MRSDTKALLRQYDIPASRFKKDLEATENELRPEERLFFAGCGDIAVHDIPSSTQTSAAGVFLLTDQRLLIQSLVSGKVSSRYECRPQEILSVASGADRKGRNLTIITARWKFEVAAGPKPDRVARAFNTVISQQEAAAQQRDAVFAAAVREVAAKYDADAPAPADTSGPPEDLFERIQLPILLKRLDIPKMDSTLFPDGRKAPLFRREATCTVLYKRAMDMLEKYNHEDDIFAFLFDEAKTPRVFLADDNGIKFYVRDTVDENGERKFLRIFYHAYTEQLNAELKEALKNFSELGECYAIAEADSYYLMSSSPSWQNNQALIAATAPIIRRYLPEGYQWALADVKPGTSFETAFKANDYEKLL